MPGLRRIGDATHRTIRIDKARRALNMSEEYIDLRFRPGDFQPTTLKRAAIHRLTIRVKTNAAIRFQKTEAVIRRHVRRTVGVIHIDKV